jgi:predicted P-loop ATPase
MKSFAAWVPALFPGAETSSKGYRISSESLGRALDEDISIHPEGIVDFGVADQGDKRRGKRTAIDVVMEWAPIFLPESGLANATDAAMWLCKQMGVEPGAIGWNPRTQVTARSLNLRVSKAGIIADEANVLLILERDPALMGLITFDEFKGERRLCRPIPGDVRVIGDRDTPRQWRDDDTIALQVYIQTQIVPRIGRDKIEAVVDLHARQNCVFHPVRDYLQRLEWDNTPRVDAWLTDYMGATSQSPRYLAAVGSKFLISAVARILKPGCQVDSALVLEGLQGIGKSSALRILASDGWFSDSLPADLAHKDARDHLRGKWIIELPELAQFKRSEIETIKSFLSRRVESYRPSYGRNEIEFNRQCVFAGTTNADEYLVDQTGNRRFWVVSCGHIDITTLARDRDQLWAEAVSRYHNGEQWHLSLELSVLAAGEANARVAHDPWTDRVVEILENQVEVSPGEVLTLMCLSMEEKHARNAGRVGQILRDLGWRKGKRHKTRGQLYASDLA